MNDKGNKFVDPPNQTLQILINTLPSHSTNIVDFESLTFSTNDLGIESNNVVNLVDKPIPPNHLCITFDPNETIVALEGCKEVK